MIFSLETVKQYIKRPKMYSFPLSSHRIYAGMAGSLRYISRDSVRADILARNSQRFATVFFVIIIDLRHLECVSGHD